MPSPLSCCSKAARVVDNQCFIHKACLKQASSISTNPSRTQCHNKTSMFIVYCKTPFIFKKRKLYWVHMSLYRCIKSILTPRQHWLIIFSCLKFAIFEPIICHLVERFNLNRLKIVLNTVLYCKPHTHMVLNSYWLIRMWTSRDFVSYLLNENSRGNWIDDDIPEVIRLGQMMLDEVKS